MPRQRSSDELEEDVDSPPPLSTPSYEMDDEEVENAEFEYSDRDASDWVSSGPIGGRFRSADAAEKWARGFFGERFVRRIHEAEEGGRWAFLIKGERCTKQFR